MTFASGAMQQTLTYWEPDSGTDRYGKPIMKVPVTRKCRWEDKTQQVQSKKGEEIVSKSRVYMTEDCHIDGYLLLGTSVQTDPTSVVGAYEVQAVAKTPSLSSLESLTTVYL